MRENACARERNCVCMCERVSASESVHEHVLARVSVRARVRSHFAKRRGLKVGLANKGLLNPENLVPSCLLFGVPWLPPPPWAKQDLSSVLGDRDELPVNIGAIASLEETSVPRSLAHAGTVNLLSPQK